MDIFQILVLILLVACSVTHLVFVFIEKETGRIITKGLIIGSLLLFALVSKVSDILIYLGLFASLVGDMLLLMKKRKLFFIVGATSFSLTHIINFIVLFRYLPNRISNWMYVVILVLLGYLLVESFRPLLKKKLDKLSYACLAYLCIVFILMINSFIITLTSFNVNFLFISVGYALFLASDDILTINMFIKPIKKGNFILMVLYILAQSFIYIPLILELNK